MHPFAHTHTVTARDLHGNIFPIQAHKYSDIHIFCIVAICLNLCPFSLVSLTMCQCVSLEIAHLNFCIIFLLFPNLSFAVYFSPSYSICVSLVPLFFDFLSVFNPSLVPLSPLFILLSPIPCGFPFLLFLRSPSLSFLPISSSFLPRSIFFLHFFVRFDAVEKIPCQQILNLKLQNLV